MPKKCQKQATLDRLFKAMGIGYDSPGITMHRLGKRVDLSYLHVYERLVTCSDGACNNL